MTPKQKLEVRQSERRQRLNELAGLPSLEDAQRTELDTLTAEYADGERQFRAAVIAEDADTAAFKAEAEAAGEPEGDAARLELRSKCSIGNYVAARLQNRQVTGAEAELAAELGTEGIPLELFEPAPEKRAALETRTATGPPTTTGRNLDALRPAVFAPSVLPRLGVEMPRVPTGSFVSGTITGNLSAGSHERGHAADADAAVFTTATATPKRISARLELRIEDIAAVGQANFEQVLRENLSLALSDELDDQGLNGAGSTAGNTKDLNGLFQALTDAADPGTVADFDAFVGTYADGVDGLWATTCKQVAMVVGVDTYRLAAKTFRDTAANGGDGATAFTDYAMSHYGALWTNARMPATASDIQHAILYRMGRSLEGGSQGIRTAVCPVWSEVNIDDIFSGSAKGERYLTFHVLLGDVIVVQAGAYAEARFKVS